MSSMRSSAEQPCGDAGVTCHWTPTIWVSSGMFEPDWLLKTVNAFVYVVGVCAGRRQNDGRIRVAVGAAAGPARRVGVVAARWSCVCSCTCHVHPERLPPDNLAVNCTAVNAVALTQDSKMMPPPAQLVTFTFNFRS